MNIINYDKLVATYNYQLKLEIIFQTNHWINLGVNYKTQ